MSNELVIGHFSQDNFIEALKQGSCDVIDTMLAQGYIPDPSSIIHVCKYNESNANNGNNVDLLTKLLKYPMDLQAGLFEAVKYPCVDILNHLFLAGANIHISNQYGRTPLFYAKHPIVCKWLLDMGASQTSDIYGDTPLLVYIGSTETDILDTNTIEMMSLLLQHPQGPETIKQANVFGQTPLLKACYGKFCRSSAAIVSTLLQYPQTIETINRVTRVGTPLLTLCSNDDDHTHTVVSMLLQYPQGIETISIVDECGNTPLSLACGYQSDPRIASALLQHPQGIQTIGIPNDGGDTPLNKACFYKNIEVVKLLLRYPQIKDTIGQDEDTIGEDISIFRPCSNGNTPLCWACSNGDDTLLARMLLQYPQGVNTLTRANNWGYTPFLRACESDYYYICCFLLEYPQVVATLDQSNNYGHTALFMACKNGNVDMVKLLLRYPQCTINKPNNEGMFPLSVACMHENTEVVKLLLSYPQIKDTIAQAFQVSTPYPEILSLLQDVGFLN